MLDSFVMRKVGALGFGQLRAIFRGVIFLASFLMVFRMTGFSCELGLVRFLFRVFTVLACFTLILLFFGFFLAMAVFLVLGNFMRFVEGFGFILVKIRSTDQRVGFGARLGLFVFRFHQSSGQRDCFFIAECRSGVARRFG